MSPMGRNTGFQYQFPPMDPSFMHNPYYMPYNPNFQYPPMQIYPYQVPNPHNNYFNPTKTTNNQATFNDTSSSPNPSNDKCFTVKNMKK